MAFFLLIIFPFLIPLAYFIDLRLIFSLSEYWHWFLAVVLILDLTYFLLLWRKNKTKLKMLAAFFLHTIFFISAGFAFMLILTDLTAINIFSVLWPLLLLIFLYAILHFSYETLKSSLIDTKSIIPYVNVASFFILTAILINLNIFLAFPWWAILPIFIVSSLVFNLPLLLLYRNNFKVSIIYSAIITLIMSEIMAVILYLPAGFYVLGAVIALSYYLIIILFQKKAEERFSTKDVIKHFSFVLILLIIILATSQWI